MAVLLPSRAPSAGFAAFALFFPLGAFFAGLAFFPDLRLAGATSGFCGAAVAFLLARLRLGTQRLAGVRQKALNVAAVAPLCGLFIGRTKLTVRSQLSVPCWFRYANVGVQSICKSPGPSRTGCSFGSVRT